MIRIKKPTATPSASAHPQPGGDQSSAPGGDHSMGLYGKYHVERVDGKPLKGGRCVVLEVGDPNAWAALAAWADTVEEAGYVPLASDVRRMLAEVRGQRTVEILADSNAVRWNEEEARR